MIYRIKTLLYMIEKDDNYKVQNLFMKLNSIYFIVFPNHYKNGEAKRRKKYQIDKSLITIHNG